MDWKEIGPYREHVIWVRDMPTGKWIVAVVPAASPPEGASTPGGPSDDRILPEAFASDAAAITAAMRHINREHERRVHRERSGGRQMDPAPMDAGLGRRRFLRFPVSLPVIALSPLGELAGRVRNVGAGGLMAEFPRQLIQDSTVDLLLQTGRGHVSVAARIVWVAPANGTVRHGCAFSEPKEESFAVGLFVGGSS
ncbi:MAG TPA: PilZ domain-containing protein [archaeon]|nr:PilZ domain-containing protein [archaeon]